MTETMMSIDALEARAAITSVDPVDAPETPAQSAENPVAALPEGFDPDDYFPPKPQPKERREPREIVEVARWHEQVGRRSRKNEIALFGLAAYSVSCSVKRIEFNPDRPMLLPVGTMTHFVLTRRWKAHKGGRLVVLRFLGYKARLTEDGRIQVGGPDGAVCGYDVKYAPFEGASPGGVIIDARKRTTLRMALDLDGGVEVTAAGAVASSIRLELPRYYAGYPKGVHLDPEDTPAVRRAVLDAVRPSYDGPVPACCRSKGGEVREVLRAPDDKRIYVAYGETGGVDELPITAILRPFVRPGAVIEEGTVIADMVPRAVYGTWEQLRRAVGDEVLTGLTHATIAGLDVQHQGLRLRDVRFCPSQLLHARQIFEAPPLVDETGRAGIQVIREDGTGRNGLVFSEGPVDVDLDAVRPSWERKFS